MIFPCNIPECASKHRYGKDERRTDMEALYDYIARTLLAPENAMGQYNRIADAILTLESFPDRSED